MVTERRQARRREFLIGFLRMGGLSGAGLGLGFWLRSRSRRPERSYAPTLGRRFDVSSNPELPEMVLITGGEPEQLVRRAVEELGGIGRFVSRGDVVVVKPNVAWDRTPEQAANTNPQAVAEMVRLCWEAEARKVIVTDVTCNDPRRCFQRSGIAEAAHSLGAEVLLPDERLFRQANLGGEVLETWPVLEPFLSADKVVNMPIAKHHSLTRVSLGMKNWYGILGGRRHLLHQRIHESLADLTQFMYPTLTIIDAYRVLTRGGPTGGDLKDVARKGTVVAGTDPVALDACVAKAYWDLDAESLPFLKLAHDRGLGNMHFEEVRARTVDL